MLINDNLYVEVEIPAINKKGFLSPTDVYGVEIVETAGASLPTLYMVFKTYDERVKNAIQENNIIKVSIGPSEADADTYDVAIVVPKTNQDITGNGWIVEFGGFIGGSKTYMVNQESKSYVGDSLKVAKQVISEEIGKELQANIDFTYEEHVTWRRNNHSACYFLADTLLHMDIRPSFPLFSFDRYGNFYVRSFDVLKSHAPKIKLTPFEPENENEYRYINNFNTKSYRASYNLYAGYNKLNKVQDTKSGKSEFSINDNEALLGSSTEAEQLNSGNVVNYSDVQSNNVHKTYKKSFIYNTNKLVALSTITGEVQLNGYYRNLAPTDLVYLKTENDLDDAVNGYYVIDTIRTIVNFSSGMIQTILILTRDNKNNIENYTDRKDRLLINTEFLQNLCSAVSSLRTAYAFALEVIDGTYMNRLLSFAIETKNNILRMFSIAGVAIDFTSQANLLKSIINTANSLMNTLVSMIFPSDVASVLWDFLILKPSLKSLLSKYISEYVPYELRDIIESLFISLYDVGESLNSIARENGIETGGIEVAPEIVEDTDDGRVTQIIQDLDNNISGHGIDVPFPIIDLTDSQKLMPTPELRDYIVTETVDNLTKLGYLDGVDTEDFENVLKGDEEKSNTPIWSMVRQINLNAGNKYNYRFWGTYAPTNEALYAWGLPSEEVNPETGEDEDPSHRFIVYTKQEALSENTRFYNSDYSPYTKNNLVVINGSHGFYIKDLDTDEEMIRVEEADVTSDALVQLTEFFIKKGFKDRYRTIPCTKLISATENSRIFFACPSTENNLRFYINSKRIELLSFPIDLGYRDSYGNKIMYNVYYTTSGYNSNSVLFEVREGV